MILEVEQFVFGIVWDVRDYGLMINTPDGWGLLHRSNIPETTYQQTGLQDVFYKSFSNFAKVGDVLILKVIQSNNWNASLAFSAIYSKTPNPIEVFKNQFGTTNVKALVDEINNKDNIINLKIKFEECKNYLYGYLDIKELTHSEIEETEKLLKRDECLDVQVAGYDFEKKSLICKLNSSWAQIKNSDTKVYLSGELTNIYLNAIEISLKNYGKIMIPFEELPGYSFGYEQFLKPKQQQVDIVINFKQKNTPIVVVTDLFESDNKLTHINKRKTALFIGATGAGKSSLINSIIRYTNTDIPLAKIGIIDPTTQSLDQYKCLGLTIFDSPRVGESTEQDKRTAENIKNWLEQNQNLFPIIVIVFDANSRDYGSSFRLMHEIKDFCSDRVICCVNKVDTLFPYGVFTHDLTIPGNSRDRILKKIQEKIDSVITRLSDVVGVQGHGISTASQVPTDKGKKMAFNIKYLIDEINSF